MANHPPLDPPGSMLTPAPRGHSPISPLGRSPLRCSLSIPPTLNRGGQGEAALRRAQFNHWPGQAPARSLAPSLAPTAPGDTVRTAGTRCHDLHAWPSSFWRRVAGWQSDPVAPAWLVTRLLRPQLAQTQHVAPTMSLTKIPPAQSHGCASHPHSRKSYLISSRSDSERLEIQV